MLSNAQEFMLIQPQLALYPGLCILVLVLAVNFIGDGLQNALNPKEKKKIPMRRLQQWRNEYLKSAN
jgi:peptide/nickel transport system permease protein